MGDVLNSNNSTEEPGKSYGPWSGILLWIAQGFGVGRIPFVPGTFGSVVGLGWFALLLASGNALVYAAGTLGGILLSVWLCGAGEKILKQTDPGSIVLDEIIAIPICFATLVGILFFKHGSLPTLDFFFSSRWGVTLAVFGLFRLFDVAKPWPVRQSQSLPGGWGVTVDDVLAALYVNLIVLIMYASSWLLNHNG
jgi:phosphatidylglycerophosphatase A